MKFLLDFLCVFLFQLLRRFLTFEMLVKGQIARLQMLARDEGGTGYSGVLPS